jgi:hypothetical protein
MDGFYDFEPRKTPKARKNAECNLMFGFAAEVAIGRL